MCFPIPSSFTELENLEVSYLHRDVSNDPLHSPALVLTTNHALIFTSILQKKKIEFQRGLLTYSRQHRCVQKPSTSDFTLLERLPGHCCLL